MRWKGQQNKETQLYVDNLTLMLNHSVAQRWTKNNQHVNPEPQTQPGPMWEIFSQLVLHLNAEWPLDSSQSLRINYQEVF